MDIVARQPLALIPPTASTMPVVSPVLIEPTVSTMPVMSPIVTVSIASILPKQLSPDRPEVLI